MNTNILFATETGLSQEVAETIASYLVACGLRKCCVRSMDTVSIDQWELLSPLVVVCSTTGQGDPPATMRASWEHLKMSDCPDLPNLQFAVFGLGDSTYPKYNYMGKMLHNRLRQLGGVSLVHRGLGDEQDAGGVWEGLEAFLKSLVVALRLSNEQFTSTALAPPVLKFRSIIEDPSSFRAPFIPYPIKTTTFTIASRKQLTSSDHFQNICHIEFERFGFDTSTVVTLHSAEDDTGISFAPAAFLSSKINLVELLVRFFDLESCASRSLFHCLKAFCNDDEERERLEELASTSVQTDYLAYCYREKRNALEVLSEFPHCAIPFDYFLSQLKPMRPRMYSLSSSPSADKLNCAITVAHLQFSTPYGRARSGLCSRWLCAAAAGDKFEGFVSQSPSRLSLEKAQPLILVGPGTGIAPMRSIIREAAALHWKAPIYLFVGCRAPGRDYLYESEWIELQKEIKLTVVTAFSRFEGKKTYVQHRIVESGTAEALASLIADGGSILICGNSKQMPRDVERAFTSVVQHFICGGSESDAVRYVNECKRDGRYITDTWS
ncbi:NADPH-cytochrome p450 reductase, putative [Bodo saltans]|uniref:NADPH-cytochrome p450 reductase, putative n=1 Tax=Bodo saltans TaxID=75058 RepID=A0A0S4KLI2_BODSA|nr:NADPH-cytochrome p450 reductase, putative [Bodo saltans]|eukprot:CUI15225.1 NADPH-cytochrome p450 reductase, putative [Bodo saltans]